MKTIKYITVVIMAIWMSGCATPPNDGNTSKEQMACVNSKNTNALVGAGIGAAAMYALSGNSRHHGGSSRTSGAILGGLIGGILGHSTAVANCDSTNKASSSSRDHDHDQYPPGNYGYYGGWNPNYPTYTPYMSYYGWGWGYNPNYYGGRHRKHGGHHGHNKKSGYRGHDKHRR